jgi:hypothetical protein
MRRLIAIIGLFTTTLFGIGAPADARAFTGVVSTAGLPSDVQVVRVVCNPAPPNPPVLSPTTTAYRHVYGVGYPPLGKGSLRINPAANRVPGLRVSRAGSLVNLTALSVESSAEVSGIYAFIFVSAGGHDWVLMADTADPTPYTWQNYDLYGESWVWRDVTADNSPYPGGSIAQFVAAHPPAPGYKVEMIAGGNCFNVTQQPLFFDDLEVGTSGTTTRYDFESTTTDLTNSVSAATIARGSTVTVSTVFTDGGMRPPAGYTVTLWAKKSGATTFSQIRTLLTDANSTASATLSPSRTTTYQWRFAGDPFIQPSRSPTKTVQVTQ